MPPRFKIDFVLPWTTGIAKRMIASGRKFAYDPKNKGYVFRRGERVFELLRSTESGLVVPQMLLVLYDGIDVSRAWPFEAGAIDPGNYMDSDITLTSVAPGINILQYALPYYSSGWQNEGLDGYRYYCLNPTYKEPFYRHRWSKIVGGSGSYEQRYGTTQVIDYTGRYYYDDEYWNIKKSNPCCPPPTYPPGSERDIIEGYPLILENLGTAVTFNPLVRGDDGTDETFIIIYSSKGTGTVTYHKEWAMGGSASIMQSDSWIGTSQIYRMAYRNNGGAIHRDSSICLISTAEYRKYLAEPVYSSCGMWTGRNVLENVINPAAPNGKRIIYAAVDIDTEYILYTYVIQTLENTAGFTFTDIESDPDYAFYQRKVGIIDRATGLRNEYTFSSADGFHDSFKNIGIYRP